MTLKRIFVFFAVLGLAAGAATAQSQSGTGRGSSNSELSVEESYLQQSVELMIIREQSRAESRDMKLVALEYIGDAIDRGNTGAEVKDALEYLGTEGTINRTRENGRLVNNYPDIRTRAATYLGDLGTVEAKDALIKMCLADNEPMVLTEVIKSLGRIAINENEETANAIAWIVKRFDILNPDNLLAVSALDALERIAAANGGIKDPNAIRTLMLIAEGNYLRPVQEKAKQVLNDLRKYNAKNQEQNQNEEQSQNQSQSQPS